MNPVLIDTDIISFFLRNQTNVVKNFKKYLNTYGRINFSIISYYEILSGLIYRDARKQLKSFLQFSELNNILPLTKKSVKISANIYAELRKKGELIDDIDILIAGIALANNLVLVTHNTAHFKKIKNLLVDDWF